jgi:TfoX/Sxy family transcriptional regulator of competence genes
MATSQNTIDFLLDQLRGVARVSARKMFGEYALYCDGKVVALVCDDQLFVKITVAGKALVGRRYAEGFAYPGAKASMLIGAEDLEDSDRLSELIRVTAAALPAPKPKTPKPSRPSKTPRPSRPSKKATSGSSASPRTKTKATINATNPTRSKTKPRNKKVTRRRRSSGAERSSPR